MCDKDKGTTMGWKANGIVTAIPKLESHFIFCPSINEGLSIGHNVVSFMTINIHSFLHFMVVPLQLCKPLLYCQQGNAALANLHLQEQILEFVACNDVTNVPGLDKACPCLL